MEECVESYLKYLMDKKEECSKQEHILSNDLRQDEANLEKVKQNVYDIFITLLHSAIKRAKDKEDLKTIYQKLIEQIPQNWRSRYETAKKLNDAATIYVEEAKIAIVDEIKVKFMELCTD